MASPYSSDDDFAQRPVLPLSAVTTVPGSSVPRTPEEYLSLVHAEAGALPAILSATADPDSDPHHNRQTGPTVATRATRRAEPPTHAAPNAQWVRCFNPFFDKLQRTLPTALTQGTRKQQKQQVPKSPDAWLALFRSKPPALSRVAAFDFVTLAAALAAVDSALRPIEHPDEVLQYLHNGHLLVWVFSLLAFLQPPVDSDTGAVLHSLLQSFSLARSVTEHNDQRTIAALNILITILENHFGQR